MKPITEAIKNATNGTFRTRGITTLMSWVPRYDEYGRPLNTDPNRHLGEITIDGKKYALQTQGWQSTIIDIETGEVYDRVDMTPDYVKEFYEKQKDDEK